MPARTLATVRANIRSDLDRQTAALPEARITEAIQTVIHTNRSRNLGFNSKRAGLSLGAEYVNLPDDFLEATRLRLDASDYVKPLVEKSIAFIHQKYTTGTFTTTPVYFAVTRNANQPQIRLYPEPDATYSAEMTYVYDLAESCSWTDALELAWFDEGYVMLKYGAMAEIAAGWITDQESVQQAAMWAQLSENARRELLGQAAGEEASGDIIPCL